MTLCPTCGAENADAARFCVKCGTTIPVAPPQPGSWQQPSGDLSSTPSGGLGNQSYGGQSGGFGGYTPPPTPYSPPVVVTGYGGAATSAGVGGLPYALWADRVLAALIDGGLIFAGIIVLWIIIGIIGGVGSAALGSISEDAGGLFGTGACCVFFVLPPVAALLVNLYNKVYLIGTRGASIGQGLMNLKVVMGDGSAVPMQTSVIRFLVQMGLGVIPIFGLLLTIINLLFPLWDPQRQTLHDKAVGTFVVKKG